MVHEHKREVKDPQVRKQEILHQAMILFTQQGYEKTSMRDIARSLHISLGLCYRYFDSKQVLFQEAMKQYVDQCSQIFIHVFQKDDLDFFQKLDAIYQLIMSEDTFAYHTFFHQPQNQSLHEELSLQIYHQIIPYMEKELYRYCQNNHCHIKNADLLIRFLTYGQIGLVSNCDMPDEKILQSLLEYIHILIHSQMIPD